MTQRRDFDVAVVGGSIAGCTAATLLARQGARVALIESHGDPRAFKRMCTHEIQGSATSTIERLGLLDAALEAGAERGNISFWTRYGWVSPSPAFTQRVDDYAPSLNIRRETLDPMLRELASGTEGVESMLGQKAVGLLGEGRRTTGVVVRDRDGAERELRAKLVVAADGRGSGIAKLAGQRTKQVANNRFAYFAYFRDTPLVTGSSLQLWFLDPDCVYAFPTDDDLTLITCVPHKNRLEEFKREPEEAMIRIFDDLPDAPRLDPEKRVGKMLAKHDAPNETRRPTGPGIAFVGDAAISADPLWGVGCGWALRSAEWLADEVGPALGGEAEVDGALKRYARRHRRELALHNRACSLYSSGRRFYPFERLALRAAARDDELAGTIVLYAERWAKPQTLLAPRNLARIVRANLRREKPAGLRAQPAS